MHRFARIFVSLIVILVAQPLSPAFTANQPGNANKFSKKQADDFANVMIRGFHIIQNEHVLRMDRAEMARCTVRGLYKGVSEPLPAMMAKRLDKLTNQEKGLPRAIGCSPSFGQA